MKASQHKRLERLMHRSASQRSACTPELARALAEAAQDTGRMVGVLCDRKGGVTDVVLGEPTRLYLPDVGRLRAGPGRLRGLRLVVAKPHVKQGPKEALRVDGDLLTDLLRLKLDAVLEIEALDDGLPGRCALATILPARPQHDDGAERSDAQHNVESFGHVNDVTADFAALVSSLEEELGKTAERVRTAAKVPGEREVAVLVGVYTCPRHEAEAQMEELKELARTAGVRVVDTVLQFRPAIDPKTIVGSGKLEELCLTALHRGAEMIIFDRDLSPSQLSAITDQTDLKVLDRTMLILDIFARRAKSKGGKMQVELAQLQYSLPRLAKRQSGLSRLTGGIGGQGPGETRLEIDRRRAKEKMQRLLRELEGYAGERQLRRQARNEKRVPVIALVGYTNAGKSTLLNRLTGADVYAADELFATLDPTSRRLRFPDEREVILIDTVGFIRDLPQTLVQAFRATLEELGDADLFLHVVDARDGRRREQMEAVERVIDDLGLGGVPRVVVLNKCDEVAEEKNRGEAARMKAVRVSAKTGAGLEDLVARLLAAWPDARAAHQADADRRLASA